MGIYRAIARSDGLSIESFVVIVEPDLGHIEDFPRGPFADIDTRVDGPETPFNAAAYLLFERPVKRSSSAFSS